MALPLPRVIPDVGPGGGLVTAMGGINKLSNDNILRQINAIKKQYAPLTTQAEAASKLAYANLMGPQFLAKLLGNDSAIANMGSDQAKAALQKAVNAGMGAGNPSNIFAQMQQQNQGPGEKLGNSLSNFFADKLRGVFGGQGQPGMGQMQGQPQQAPQQQPMQMPTDAGQQSAPMAPPMGNRPKDGVTLEGEQWYNAKGEPVYSEEVEETGQPTMELELTKGIPPKKSYAENTGDYKGTVKQREEEGKYRAAARKQIGESQLGLSHSGAVLDRMTGIVKNPVFANMRNTIPGFQNKQLDYLKTFGTPEQKELIGDFLSTGESFIASTVQGFSGKPLVREFDLAQRQKITPHDTIDSAIGKLQSATALHDIAEKKNGIVDELLAKGYNEAEAVKMANKMVDVSAIEEATKKRLQRKIQIRNNKTGVTKEVTLEEARKMGVPNV